ncbi:hypothetical protein [Oceanirhabdus seepicola]|uniref:Uncharacterized protein n=1 Tax=Oceanirhabdus seepicola TaxID=2828781 RepID=A0A9J6PAX8_9CLOT|nr:hypothetical protein [Oceanirhabdus seepicola]MCM1992801.1 hypothetical protein [Oceanirhabdus seepicola]
MYKKTRILITLIVVLLLSNIVLAYNFYDKRNKEHQRELILYARATISIDDAVNYIGKLNYQWDSLSNTKKMDLLGDAQVELVSALYSMSDSLNYFSPLKLYVDAIITMEHKIINHDDPEIQKNYISALNNDFRVLSKFLAENNILEMTYEDTIEHWENIRSELKTKELFTN